MEASKVRKAESIDSSDTKQIPVRPRGDSMKLPWYGRLGSNRFYSTEGTSMYIGKS